MKYVFGYPTKNGDWPVTTVVDANDVAEAVQKAFSRQDDLHDKITVADGRYRELGVIKITWPGPVILLVKDGKEAQLWKLRMNWAFSLRENFSHGERMMK